jgi:hypothetical protein
MMYLKKSIRFKIDLNKTQLTVKQVIKLKFYNVLYTTKLLFY